MEDKISCNTIIVYRNQFGKDKPYKNNNVKFSYTLKTKNRIPISQNFFEKLKIDRNDVWMDGDIYTITATSNQIEILSKNSFFDTVYKLVPPKKYYNPNIFPHDKNFKWNAGNFGSVIIPQKGVPIKLSSRSISQYKQLIETYENNSLSIRNSTIVINGKTTNTYTPKMDYYFICNDNRDNSMDSRHFGFVPENHIYAKVIKVFENEE